MTQLIKEKMCCYDAKLNECLKDYACKQDYEQYCKYCTGTEGDEE